mmetsp:Transcript_16531/g.49954  ORF Transcript_16531/g.49954 Transcript_16531/m.49954 type:complete len:200 (+) Transcript_16531:540-1139(+)
MPNHPFPPAALPSVLPQWRRCRPGARKSTPAQHCSRTACRRGNPSVPTMRKCGKRWCSLSRRASAVPRAVNATAIPFQTCPAYLERYRRKQRPAREQHPVPGGVFWLERVPHRIKPRVVGVEQSADSQKERGSQRPAEGEWLRAGGHGGDLERPHWRRVLHVPRARRPGPGGEARSKEFKQNNSGSQQTGSTQVRTGAC